MSDAYKIHHGDCLEVLRTMPDCSVDAVVTDPPYGLSFMGKRWDYDVPSVEVWAECLRVLKPGGYLLAFAGTRTQHRMAVRIEDAGFEIRDMIAWVYGSGFPKSLDVSKAIDKAAGVAGGKGAVTGKSGSARNSMEGDFAGGEYHEYLPATEQSRQWQGWGTALKPALEPITVARKPLAGTVAANVLEHGTGALNIDGCRVATDGEQPKGSGARESWRAMEGRTDLQDHGENITPAAGRWPANLIHDGSDEVLAAFPDAPGQMADASTNSDQRKTQNTYGAMRRGRGDEPSAESKNEGSVGFKMKPGMRRLDAGSAARFFYCAKASKADRNEGCEHIEAKQYSHDGRETPIDNAYQRNSSSSNSHPTVKPTELMRYLCRLVTPPGDVVLDPFTGSGSTGKAAVLDGFRFVGIEREAEYVAIARARIEHALRQPKQHSLDLEEA